VNRKHVERLMRQAGIQGVYCRRGRKNLVHAATEEDLVKRDFTAGWPDALWLTDITEHPTGEGKLYCGAVMAVFSRKVIGWSIAARQDSELVTKAPVDGRHQAAAPRGKNSTAFRPRNAVHGMGVRDENPGRRNTRLPWEQSETATTTR